MQEAEDVEATVRMALRQVMSNWQIVPTLPFAQSSMLMEAAGPVKGTTNDSQELAEQEMIVDCIPHTVKIDASEPSREVAS